MYFTTICCLLFPKNVDASTIYFEDDFSGDLSKWQSFRGDISSWSIQDGMVETNTGGVVEIIPNDQNWPDPLFDRYIYEVDMMPMSGVDRNISFRVQATDRWAEIHHTGDSTGWYHIYLERVFGTPVSPPPASARLSYTENKMLENGVQYHFKIVVDGTKTKIYITEPDSVERLLIDYNDIDSPLIGGKIGLRVGSARMRFDNVVVTELPDEEEETLPVLTVPDLKQYSLPWKNKIYDHKKASIEKFGCALTAASMVLQYHGHNIMPDDLNNWLKNEPDGYFKNGLINWLAVSRYTKDNYSPQSRTLEYKRLDPTTENLDNELNNDRPAILKEPGHFVVATGKTTDSYLINDPGYSDRTNLSSYDNNFLKINSYTPTDSNLSYMMFVTDPDIDLEITSSSGLILPIDSFVEDPITNLLNPDKKSGNPVKIYLFEKPETGKYTLKATGPKGKYNLESYLYNTDGKVTKNSFDGRLNGNDTDTFNISFEGKNKIKEADKKPYCKFFKKNFWKNWW